MVIVNQVPDTIGGYNFNTDNYFFGFFCERMYMDDDRVFFRKVSFFYECYINCYNFMIEVLSYCGSF